MAAHLNPNLNPNLCFTNTYDDVLQSTPNETHILFNLSLLTDKTQQLQSLATIFFTKTQTASDVSSVAAVAALLQDIIIIASNTLFTCQNLNVNNTNINMIGFDQMSSLTQSNEIMFDCSTTAGVEKTTVTCNASNDDRKPKGEEKKYDIVEMAAVDLLAKYTHYCQVCGKGFKRDANLRMHMRAHGDEYKSNAALANPIALEGRVVSNSIRKYSCPQEGCRWNRKHAKFQPLKSMICMKNHYKRSHCPKMYVCKRCQLKRFSVLSDLRTHEKHCGDVKWRCSCGTTFSRKDKLMGHVGLFLGHTPLLLV